MNSQNGGQSELVMMCIDQGSTLGGRQAFESQSQQLSPYRLPHGQCRLIYNGSFQSSLATFCYYRTLDLFPKYTVATCGGRVVFSALRS